VSRMTGVARMPGVTKTPGVARMPGVMKKTGMARMTGVSRTTGGGWKLGKGPPLGHLRSEQLPGKGENRGVERTVGDFLGPWRARELPNGRCTLRRWASPW